MNSNSTSKPSAESSAVTSSPKRSAWGFLKTGFALTCFAALGAGIGYIYMEVVDLNSNLVTRTDELQGDVDRQKQRNESIDKGILNLQAAMRESKEANRAIADSMGLLSDQISTLGTDLTQDIAEVANKQKAISSDVVSLNKTTSTQANLIKSTQSQLATARKDLEDVSRDIDNQIASLTEGVATNDGQIASLGNSFARANEALDSANQLIADLETRYATLQDEVGFMQNGFADQQSQIAELASGFATVRDELARAHATNTETIAAVEEVAETFSEEPETAIDVAVIDEAAQPFADEAVNLLEEATGAVEEFIIAETEAEFEAADTGIEAEVAEVPEIVEEVPQLDPILANDSE